jgi:hypothetical protein
MLPNWFVQSVRETVLKRPNYWSWILTCTNQNENLTKRISNPLSSHHHHQLIHDSLSLLNIACIRRHDPGSLGRRTFLQPG